MLNKKAFLFNGYLKFYTHKVTYDRPRKERNEDGELVDVTETIERNFYEQEGLNAYIQRLDEREIEYTIEEYEQPSEELIDKAENIKFNTMQEAREFIETGYLQKSDAERINDLELIVLQLGGVI